MAAMNSLSLLCGPLSLRALHFIRTSNPSPRSPLFSPPLHFRRVLSSVSAISDEEAAARAAAVSADSGAPTIFDKIISKEIPSTIVYEDEAVLAFRDISPQAPVHVLVIPKLRDVLTELGKAEKRHEEILGRLLYAAKIVAEKEGIIDGFRVVVNSGPSACQICLPSSLTCARRETDEMATRGIAIHFPDYCSHNLLKTSGSPDATRIRIDTLNCMVALSRPENCFWNSSYSHSHNWVRAG
ncbi:Adenylylsulfatase HINT1 [Sesamum angolense]|uniref:Adenylylsulfatase HINT1 n=1 Tax=Sesamum angolense TaxID=2727404 RepID=A0AAE1W446_9LAMI|nr:Adenylylsulfatase HINT1 [Sesamum angolense]